MNAGKLVVYNLYLNSILSTSNSTGHLLKMIRKMLFKNIAIWEKIISIREQD